MNSALQNSASDSGCSSAVAGFGLRTPRFASARHKRAHEVAATLAWAAANDLPFAAALESLRPAAGTAALTGCLGCVFLTGPLVAPLFVGQARCNAAVQRVIEALREGWPLGVALSENMQHILPPHYLRGVCEADELGRLKELLPVLARTLGRPGQGLPPSVQGFWTFYVVVLMLALSLASAVVYFIVPKYLNMTRALGDEPTPAPLLLWLDRTADQWLGVAGGLTLLLVPLLLLGLFVWHFMIGPATREYNYRQPAIDAVGSIVAAMLGCLPVAGRLVRLRQRLTLAQSMGVALRCGQDVIQAAAWTSASTGSVLLSRRLRRFVAAASAGQQWFAAWRHARLFDPTGVWLLQNAAAREDLAGGFELVAELTAAEVERLTRRLNRWLTVALPLLLGLVVGVVVLAVFKALVAITDHACALSG